MDNMIFMSNRLFDELKRMCSLRFIEATKAGLNVETVEDGKELLVINMDFFQGESKKDVLDKVQLAMIFIRKYNALLFEGVEYHLGSTYSFLDKLYDLGIITFDEKTTIRSPWDDCTDSQEPFFE
ncbi:MAG: hypothetical protein E7078_03745 [Bacteroidales bacterium]|nr:hypothetical protein [Bacteroidales bacterium]